MKEIYSTPVASDNNKKEICGRFILPPVEDVRKKEEYLKGAIDAIRNYDQETFNHTLRVANWAATIAKELQMDEKEKELFISAALVHDVGKIKIDKKILNKPGKLNDEEYNEMKKHVDKGIKYLREKNVPREVIAVMAGHHEFQGDNSYPRQENQGKEARIHKVGHAENNNHRERKEKIRHLSRLLAMVDHFEAATDDRPGREAISLDTCRAEMNKKFKEAGDKKIINILTRA